MNWVSNLISIGSLIVSCLAFLVSYLAHREATKGADIILIIDEEKEAQVHIESRMTQLIHYQEAYIILPLVFLNRGSKGGAVIDIQPEITNLSPSDRLKINYDFKDGSGKIIDPRFFLPSIEAREGIPVSLEFSIKFALPKLLDVPTSRWSDIRQIFQSINNVLKVRISYKRVCSNGKLIHESKEIKLLLNYK